MLPYVQEIVAFSCYYQQLTKKGRHIISQGSEVCEESHLSHSSFSQAFWRSSLERERDIEKESEFGAVMRLNLSNGAQQPTNVKNLSVETGLAKSQPLDAAGVVSCHPA